MLEGDADLLVDGLVEDVEAVEVRRIDSRMSRGIEQTGFPAQGIVAENAGGIGRRRPGNSVFCINGKNENCD